MRTTNHQTGHVLLAVVLGVLPVASGAPFLPDFNAATFTANSSVSDSPYFPLMPGTVYISEGREVGDGQTTLNRTFVTFETMEILGVRTRAVRDTGFVDGLLSEDTRDFFAQDTAGNVWYMGEDTTAFEYDEQGNLIGTSKEGSWQAGVDDALPGFIMQANPAVGDNYFQEFAPNNGALDQATVISLDRTISIDLGTFTNVQQILETTQLDPDSREFKYYAPGIGLIFTQEDLDEDLMNPQSVVELVSVEVIPAPAALPLVVVGLGAAGWFRRRLR